MSALLFNQLVQFVAGIAILIFVHELGHFLAARLFKVEVEEFGIGFPPRLLNLFEAGGTKFTLNWIPLGGFTKLKGENDPNVKGGLAAASPWVRLGVIVAGPLTNLLVGILLAILLVYNIGEPIPDRVKIQYVAPQSPAETAGIQPGDVIIKVEDQEIKSTELILKTIYGRLGTPTKISYQRGGQTYSVTLTPRNPPPANEGAIGVIIGNENRPITWIKAIPSGVKVAYQYSTLLLLLPVNLLRGNITPEQARPVGYKGMFDIYQQLRDPILFFMMITMSLGMFNLFPIPALDGGRILLTLPEIIFRRRVPPQYENMIHMVGFAVLLLLLIYINLQDFINPVKLPF